MKLLRIQQKLLLIFSKNVKTQQTSTGFHKNPKDSIKHKRLLYESILFNTNPLDFNKNLKVLIKIYKT